MKSGIDDVTLAEIAFNSNARIEDVYSMYQQIMNDLHKKARIHDFIPLLAMNRLRAHLQSPTQSASTSSTDWLCIDINAQKNNEQHEYLVETVA